ncbi:hypothetical protein GCM10020358_69150 [Amorphoplanes nipponensis]|uniref:Uncharacterized protein n=1 Tax=Actinoplanes nipponensis TaxID=135950 RepID=A0A919MKS7_9ACTN|nr:hypothetical protein [Actinoplanes nipponensis]GIE53194.1 hypothetical protein Ani05nite_67280 [Actinoplanes nipponensis]
MNTTGPTHIVFTHGDTFYAPPPPPPPRVDDRIRDASAAMEANRRVEETNRQVREMEDRRRETEHRLQEERDRQSRQRMQEQQIQEAERQGRDLQEASRQAHERMRRNAEELRSLDRDLTRLREVHRELATLADPLPAPRSLIDQHRSWWGLRLNTGQLAGRLASLAQANPEYVSRVLAELSGRHAGDTVLRLADQLEDDQIKSLSQSPAGRQLLIQMLGHLHYPRSGRITYNIIRIINIMSPSHQRLREEPWVSDPRVQAALERSGTSLQRAELGADSYIFDEYAVVINEIPRELDLSRLVTAMAAGINEFAESSRFDMLTRFQRRAADRPPTIGELIDIDISGPDDGTVMLVELTDSRFVYQTVATSPHETGAHPEFGAREFGIERLDGDSAILYTRGFSRGDWLIKAANEFTGPVSIPSMLQRWAWQSLLDGASHAIGRQWPIRTAPATWWFVGYDEPR